MKWTIVVVIIFTFGACNDSNTTNDPTYLVETLPNGVKRVFSNSPAEQGRWHITPIFDIKPEDESLGELIDPDDIRITSDGMILVADNETHVKVFDSDGKFLRTIGQRGSGPGEFRSAFIASRNDTLFVHDAELARGNTFLLSSGEFLGSIPTSCCNWSSVEYDGLGNVVNRSNVTNPDSLLGSSQAFIRTMPGSSVSDTVFVYKRKDEPNRAWRVKSDKMALGIRIPFVPQDLQATDTKGAFITAWTGEYLFRVTSDGRDTTELFGRAFTPERVSIAEKQAIVEQKVIQTLERNPNWFTEPLLRESMDPAGIPNIRPAFERFWVDPVGRTWTMMSSSDTSTTLFDVFDTDRKWLDSISVPYEQLPGTDIYRPMFWSEDRAAVVLTDDNGLPFIRVYSVNRT